MYNYFIWFKIKGDILPEEKSRISTTIHSIIFEEGGIKFTTKSNAFFYKSDDTAEDIVIWMEKISNNNIKCFVIEVDGDYYGTLDDGEWGYLD